MKEDAEIIDLFFERSEQAISELSEKYGAACNLIAKNILQNQSDAEECVNDAYLAIWNKIPPETPNPLRSYLFKIVRNIASVRYRANLAIKRNSFYDMALDELSECIGGASTVEGQLEASELARQLDVFLDSLNKEDRVMFMRRYWFSDSPKEIALRFGISENNVYVRLSRVRNKLKNHLKKEGYEI